MKGIYEVLHYTWINDKICDTVVHDRELHYGEIPPNKTTTYTVDDLDILEKKLIRNCLVTLKMTHLKCVEPMLHTTEKEHTV